MASGADAADRFAIPLRHAARQEQRTPAGDPLLLIVSLGFNYKEAFYLHTRSFIHIMVSDEAACR